MREILGYQMSWCGWQWWCVATWFIVDGMALAAARVAGKIGIYSNNYSGGSITGINEEIIWVSIGMAITIAILITIALCYLMKEKCDKHREFYVIA